MNPQMSLVSALAVTLLHSTWQLALIGLLAAFSFTAMRRSSAQARHSVGMLWLVAMLTVPAVTFAICWQSPSLAVGNASLVGPVATSDIASSSARLAFDSPLGAWALVCLAQLWLLGVIAMTVRHIGGWRLLTRIERQDFTVLPPAWQQRVASLSAALGIRREVLVKLSDRIASPFTSHVMRPLIWFPLSLLSRLPADQIEALFAHELAHIRRLDWCWNAIQCAIETVLFHHPAMWWLTRRIREERELACDDLAAAVCGDAVVVAEALIALRQPAHRFGTPRLGLAADGGQLMKRITHLLSGKPARSSWRATAALVLLLGSGCLVAMQVAPPAHVLTNLTIDASSQGELTPGNYRDFAASYLGEKQRHYRISMDERGQVTERYAEDGEPRPIDERVRHWLDAMTTMGMPSAPAALPALPPASPASPLPHPSPLPPLSPLPPAPPAPPASPADSVELVALVDSIRSDEQVIAITGLPVSYDRASFHGSVHTWGARDFHLWGIDDPVGGKASFTMNFAGPNGQVAVKYVGKTTSGGGWKAETIELAPIGH